MEQIINEIRTKSTEEILEATVAIGGETKAARMVRAALVEVYKEREGEDAADVLMDSIGI